MDELLERFLTYLQMRRNASPYTVKNYGNDIGQFIDYCREQGVGSPERVDRSLLRSYLAELDTVGYAKASIARRVSELRSFGDFLMRERILEHNPFRTVSAPRIPRRLPKYLTVAEVEALLETEGNRSDGPRYLACNERLAANRTFVIEQDPVRGVDAVGLAVVDRDPVRVKFGDGVGRARIERGLFVLRNFLHEAVELRRGGLIEPGLVLHLENAQGLEQPDRAQRVRIGRVFR